MRQSNDGNTSVASGSVKFDFLNEIPSVRRFESLDIWIAASLEILWYVISSCKGVERLNNRSDSIFILSASKMTPSRRSICRVSIGSNPNTGPAIGSGLFPNVFKSIKKRDGEKNNLIHTKYSQLMKHVNLCKFGSREPFGKYRSRS